MLTWLKSLYTKVWDSVLNSGTILLNRLEAISGFLLAAVGSIDWSALMSLSISPSANWKAAAALGSVLMVRGVVGELIRRRNTVLVNDRLMPAEATKTELKAVKAKK